MARSRASAAAEILFLRKQLVFYQERKIKPRRFDDAARLSLLLFLEALRLKSEWQMNSRLSWEFLFRHERRETTGPMNWGRVPEFPHNDFSPLFAS